MEFGASEPLAFTLEENLGSGTSANIRKVNFKNQVCAAKIFHGKGDSQNREFRQEIKRLSQLSHPNIIKLIAYGIFSEDKSNCLIIEYADMGSLFHVLYEKSFEYKINHAISWLKQCSDAFSYMHSLKPKPIVHRDLKPLNLLLMNGGRLLKVCDFGTACDIRTIMTHDRGSPCWMAPEVITCTDKTPYDEKCDVYSYAITAWEILTRQKPYFDVNYNRFQLIFKVTNDNLRPKPIRNCPRILKLILERGMHADKNTRPSMQMIFNIMSYLDSLVNKNPIEPLVENDEESYESPGSKSENSSNPGENNTIKIENYKNTTFLRSESKHSLLNNKSENNMLSPTSAYGEFKRDVPYRLSANRIGEQKPISGHKRSKSYGSNGCDFNDKALFEKAKINEELNILIEKTIYDPLNPIENNHISKEIYAEHKKLIDEDILLQETLTKLTNQKDQLEHGILDIKTYNDLMKQKSMLLVENSRLKNLLKN